MCEKQKGNLPKSQKEEAFMEKYQFRFMLTDEINAVAAYKYRSELSAGYTESYIFCNNSSLILFMIMRSSWESISARLLLQ